MMAAARARKTGTAITAIALAGAAVSAYLSWHKLAGGHLWCAGGGSCDFVNASAYAEFMGVPVALLGLAAYLALAVLGLLWRGPRRSVPDWIPLITTIIVTFSWIFSAYLTYIEAFVLHAYCIWCLVSFALLSLLLAVVLSFRAPVNDSAQPPPPDRD